MEQIRSHGINPKIFSFKDIDRVEVMRKPGYRKILVVLKNNSYSARADLKLKNTDENVDLFMEKVREEDIPVKEELLAEKVGKEKKDHRFNRILLPNQHRNLNESTLKLEYINTKTKRGCQLVISQHPLSTLKLK